MIILNCSLAVGEVFWRSRTQCISNYLENSHSIPESEFRKHFHCECKKSLCFLGETRRHISYSQAKLDDDIEHFYNTLSRTANE